MAFKNESVTSLADLVSKLNTWMTAHGWTSEKHDAVVGDWAMRRTTGATNLRFAAAWDVGGTVSALGLYHYVGGNYNGSKSPWQQDDDSGNGYAGRANANLITSRHVVITNTPIQYWAFEFDDYTHIVVESSAGEFAHFGFGLLNKLGQDWTGGEYVYGQKNSGSTGSSQAIRDNASYVLDGYFNDTPDAGDLSNNSELLAATIHAEGLPNQAAGGLFVVNMGGGTTNPKSPQTDFGLDRQSNDGSSSDTARGNFMWGLRGGWFANHFYRTPGDDSAAVELSGQVQFWPIAMTYEEGSNIHGTPIAYMPDVFGCSIETYDPGEVLNDEFGNLYYVFPARKKWPGTGAETGTSGYLGIAYKIASDPPLPSSLPTPSGWWSSSATQDYTVVDDEVTEIKDKSPNGGDWSVPATKTGPALKKIGVKNWFDFPVGDGRVMSQPQNTFVQPGGFHADFTYVAVYKAVDSGNGPGCIFGNIKTAATAMNFGIFVGVTTSRSLYFQMRDNAGATRIVEHDNASFDYTDDTVRLSGVSYDDSEADLLLYGGNQGDLSSSVDSDLVATISTVNPDTDMFFGDWSNAYDRAFEGQIAEVICFDEVLTGAQRQDLEDFLYAKWSI